MCSICLEGRSNVSTQCGHLYHFKCLYEWTIRKSQCPLCKSEQVGRVWVYCQKCLRRKGEVTIREVPFLRVGNVGNFECQKCREWSFVFCSLLTDFMDGAVIMLDEDLRVGLWLISCLLQACLTHHLTSLHDILPYRVFGCKLIYFCPVSSKTYSFLRFLMSSS